jgi:hypothetical protein
MALSVAITAITLAGPVNAGAATSTNGDHAIGSGVRAASSSTDVPFTFSVHAVSPARPGGVYGTFSGSFPHDPFFRDRVSAPGDFATFSGDVTCLQVSGDTATIGGVITSGYGYDGVTTGDGFSQDQVDLAGDWFITTAQDPYGGSTDTMGYIDWGDRTYFTTAGYGYTSVSSMCNDPTADLGTAQFPLASGDIRIGR